MDLSTIRKTTHTAFPECSKLPAKKGWKGVVRFYDYDTKAMVLEEQFEGTSSDGVQKLMTSCIEKNLPNFVRKDG